MFTISKRFEFSASHQLAHLPEEHPCSRLHGHNYVVEVELQAELLDACGFVVDYGELKAFKEYLDTTFDHHHINGILSGFPTAENLALYFYGWCASIWPQTAAVRVSETSKTWAEYRPTKEPER
jgi:6-pyruvoyltetrahydropterin/6-carboxytetrahydropterin synthase